MLLIAKMWLKLIVLLLLFLTFNQKVHAQTLSKTTKNSVNYTCIPNTLLDTMIHDLKERKLLLQKDSILTHDISILISENSVINTNYNKQQKSLYIEQGKRTRNGWQRNFFILTTIIATYLCIR